MSYSDSHQYNSSHTKASPWALKVLPQFYYLNHFEAVLKQVLRDYPKDFDEKLFQEARNFLSLPQNERCVVVRAFNRKKNFFSEKDFSYPEISHAEKAFFSLLGKGVFRVPLARDFLFVLPQMTKEELRILAARVQLSLSPQLKKEAMILRLKKMRESVQDEDLDFLGFIFDRQLVFEQLLFLYFGSNRKDMSAFTLRDLQVTKSSGFKISRGPRFESALKFQNIYFFSKIFKDIEILKEDTLHIYPISNWPEPKEEPERRLFNKVLLRMAKLKNQSSEAKRELLAKATGPPARIENVRVLLKEEEESQSKELLKKILSDPGDGDELILAENLFARHFSGEKLNQQTKVLRQASQISIDEAYRGKPEWGLRSELMRRGYTVDRAENNLWCGLFGLLFWDLLFGENSRGMLTEFDFFPATLRDQKFYTDNKEKIEKRLEHIKSSQTLLFILKNFTENYGKRNSLFIWRKSLYLKIQRLIENSEAQALEEVLLGICQDFRNNKSGYPDLVAYKDGCAQFIEVKAEGDVIRPNQLHQLKRLEQAGFKAEVITTRYSLNENQEYVVVDIETTGSNKPGQKITEIGAVKVRGLEIVDEWTTLLDPRRLIPKNIVKLTGISNELVKGAPLFEEVRQEFLDFLGEAIFVAHNVRFDYGFIQREFQSLNESFICPNACTVRLARKHLPGFKSYSLKNLCRDLDIDLETHHRALHDARAAAQILIKVNRKRLGIDL